MADALRQVLVLILGDMVKQKGVMNHLSRAELDEWEQWAHNLWETDSLTDSQQNGTESCNYFNVMHDYDGFHNPFDYVVHEVYYELYDEMFLHEQLQDQMEQESLRRYAHQHAEETSRRYRRRSLPAWVLLEQDWLLPSEDEHRLRLGFGQRKMNAQGRKKHSKGRPRAESLCRQDDPAAHPDFVLECGCAPEDRCDCPL